MWMKRTALAAVGFGVAAPLLAGGATTGCGGGTLGGNGGGAPFTGAGGATAPSTSGSGAGRPDPGSAGETGSGVGGDIGPPPGGRGGGGTMTDDGGVDSADGGLQFCPASSPVCGRSCGNGLVDTCLRMVGRDCHLASVSEDCDGTDFGPRTCQTLGYGSGDLSCSPTCTLDYSGCSECAATGLFLLECGGALASREDVIGFGLAATDDEVGVAIVDEDPTNGASRLSFARLSPALEMLSATALDDTSQPYPPAATGSYQPAVATIANGWVVGLCGSPDIVVHAVDAEGRDLGRTVVAHVIDPEQACQSETLSLAARPGDGPLMLWRTSTGVTAALISADGLSAAAPMRLVGPEVTVRGASAAWVAGRFYVAVAIAPRDGGSEAIRIVAIDNDGSGAVLGDFAVSSVDGTPRLAAGASDLRVTYPGMPGAATTSGTPPPDLGIVWQGLAPSGQPATSARTLAVSPGFFGTAPAIALGGDTAVLVSGSGHDELGVVRVGPDGALVTPYRSLAKAPTIQIDAYDMARRGPDLIVGWLSPSTGAIELARIAP